MTLIGEDLHEKLQAAEESLHEYRWPYCRFPWQPWGL